MTERALRVGGGAGVKAVCVFVHGRGQSPEEMQSHVLARLDTTATAFVLPRAVGGVWYAARAVDPLTCDTRAELGRGLNVLEADIVAARAEHPGLPLLLAGFSQGACLALEYAFSGRPGPDALAALTGCRVGVSADGRPQAVPRGLPVYLSGGDADPWIPVEAMADAALDLARGGAALRSDVFPGRPHEVSGAEIAILRAVLHDMAAGRDPAMGAPR
ncbi:alpha/beta hydrolase [Roseivivax sediminis]|uniref:Phospholipase/carboxylesterase n=1 Tax=Roseivivax sediminis TaxID=936889 RepID=A0A1I1T3M0_9RHOB|nr:phospholipase [Roseivivax sediminis]SFD53202.1 phospholipase/carboxylesterase [Roseivivax sediminis]